MAAVLVSLLLGALTHLAWDAFTHPQGPAVRALPVLRRLLFSISGYQVFVFKVLQHGSTLVGVLMLVWWVVQWFRRSPAHDIAPGGLSGRARLTVLFAVAGTACAVAVIVAARYWPADVSLETLRPYVFHAAVAALPSLGVGLIVYCLAWHGYHALRRAAR